MSQKPYKRKRTSSATRRPSQSYIQTQQMMDVQFGSAARPQNLFGAKPGTGIPLRMYPIKHRICGYNTLNPTAGEPIPFTKKLNSLYETFDSHQPMGFDQFSVLYQFYKVVKAKMTCFFWNSGNTVPNDSLIVGIQFHENASWSPADANVVIERGNVSFKPLALANGSPSMVKVSRTWDINKWYGRENASGKAVSGTNGADPDEIIYATAFCVHPGADNPAGVKVFVVIDYEAEWYGPLQTNQST